MNKTLADDYVEIESQKNIRYIMSLNNMLKIDKNNIYII